MVENIIALPESSPEFVHCGPIRSYESPSDVYKVYLECCDCKKILHVNPERDGKIVAAGTWKCRECLNKFSLFVSPAITQQFPKNRISGSPFDYHTWVNTEQECSNGIPNHNCDPKEVRILQKYKRLGSKDVYAVQYDNGNVIKSVEPEKEQPDIREMDSKGKFGFPKRYISPQFR